MLRVLLLLLLVGCAGETSETQEPLKCKSVAIVETPDGLRLLVECTREVESHPVECEDIGEGSYLCNTYHADAVFCDSFPGSCEGG